MLRREFIKSLTLIPVILGAGRVTFIQESEPTKSKYHKYFYGGNAGGGKTMHMHAKQKEFIEALDGGNEHRLMGGWRR